MTRTKPHRLRSKESLVMPDHTRSGSRVTRLTASGGNQETQANKTGSQHGTEAFAQIKVIGIGGGGSNAVDRMIRSNIVGLEFITVNTDAQALMRSLAPTRIRLGDKATSGLGAGGDPTLGARAAEENSDEIVDALDGADMVFIAAGMGGGTGTGAGPIIAEIAGQIDALTVAVVTRPFQFEGSTRARLAEDGLEALHSKVDTLITIPNDRILQLADQKMPITDAFRLADDVLRQAIQGISDLITQPGLINLDFNDVRAIMKDAGTALMALGQSSGENRATKAIEQALNSPLLDVSIDGARGVLLNFTGGMDLSLFEVNEAASVISQAADPDANIIFGAVIDEDLDGDMKVTVIATGFEEIGASRRRRSSSYPSRVRQIDMPSSISSRDVELPAFLRQRNTGKGKS